MRTVALISVVAVMLPSMGLAHGDLHEQIAQVTASLQKSPGNAELLFKRAELYRAHMDWREAEADYDALEKLAPELDAVHLGRGKLLLATGRFEPAEVALDRFLAAHPEHVEGLVTRARVRAKQRDYRAAAADFATAIRLSAQPEPEHYLESAQALEAAGGEHIAEALRVLDEGLTKLGSLPTLGFQAIDFEVKRGAYDAALARLERLSAGARRKEMWLERRGDILAKAGRLNEAQQAFHQAREAIAALPNHLRTTKAMLELEGRLKVRTAAAPKTE